MPEHPINQLSKNKKKTEEKPEEKISHDFDIWNEKKKRTHHKKKKIPDFKVGEIWWVQLGKNISTESLGKGDDFLRPVLILKKVFGSSALIIPLTSQRKKGSYYFEFKDCKGHIQNAILPQIRYIDGKRLMHQLSEVSDEIFLDIEKEFLNFMKL